jgi:hypothetical protein
LGGLTDAIAQAFLNPPQPPPRTVTNIMNDFARSSKQFLLRNPGAFQWPPNFGILFFDILLQSKLHYLLKQAMISSGNVTPTETEQNYMNI